jgi:hypothetical protein
MLEVLLDTMLPLVDLDLVESSGQKIVELVSITVIALLRFPSPTLFRGLDNDPRLRLDDGLGATFSTSECETDCSVIVTSFVSRLHLSIARLFVLHPIAASPMHVSISSSISTMESLLLTHIDSLLLAETLLDKDVIFAELADLNFRRTSTKARFLLV